MYMKFKVYSGLCSTVQFFCLNKIIPRLEKPETYYRLFIADCGLHPLYLHAVAKNIAVQSWAVTRHLTKMCMTCTVCDCTGGQDQSCSIMSVCCIT
jgi:hypothetical protein